jgi:tetratricopeptide (TPR) repeat protein
VNRIILCFAVALAAMAPTRAFADDKPTKDQLDQAKKAFAEGKSLHDAGKLTEAVEKFKESYRLSKNPLLLYNIGLTLDEAGQKDNALLYYRKFLSDAPAEAAQRATATDRVKALEKEKIDADLNGNGPAAKSEPAVATTTPPKADVKPAKPIKPAGTYSATDFQHQALDSVPPRKPVDVTAFVPEDSGWTVTLYYRGNGESTFTSRNMVWRYKELVARIPAKKVNGNSVQYYVEVKDQAGTVVTRSGKPTDPNLVSIDAGAQPHFYMDMTDDAAGGAAAQHAEDEDPLHPRSAQATPTPTSSSDDEPSDNPTTPGEGFTDVGSQKFKYTKWGTTIGASTLLAAAIGTYLMAGHEASLLVADSKNCGTPPCRQFDSSYDKAYQDSGKNYQTISNVTLVLGVATAGVAGYFWYKEMQAKKKGELKASSAKAPDPDMTWLVLPAVGDGFAGATAAARF